MNPIRYLNEDYDDVSLESVKSRPKLVDYKDYLAKKSLGGYTYIQVDTSEDDGWHLWSKILVFDNKDGTEVANSSFGKEKKGDKLKATIGVRGDKRRQGIASNVYQWIEELTGEVLHPDIPHSGLAKLLWANPNRKFGPK